MNSAKRIGFIGVALCLLLALAPRASAAESLAAGVDFLAQDAAAFLADVPSGKFAVLQFVEEPADPSQPLQQPAETAGLGIQLSQLLTESLQRMGKATINRPLLCEVLRRNQFKVEDLGKPDRIRALFGGGELAAVIYGRMRREGGVITVGIDAVKTGPNMQVTFLPQGRNISIGMNGGMYALCGMNGMLQPAPGVVVTPGQVQTVETAMVITGPLQPQAPIPPAQPYNIEVLVNGMALPCYRNYKGDFYVPATLNQAYQIRLTNNTDQSAAVALLIDGLGSIGKQRALPSLTTRYTDMPTVEAPADVYKFVVQPRSNVVVKGWQIDGRVAREFVFVPAERSVAGERDFWDYIGGISAAFYPIVSQPQQTAQQITRSVNDGEKALPSVGTGQGAAFENQTTEVSAVYDRNPAAVMGLFYEQAHVISAANMTPVVR
jgi:hypothetical protein